MTPKKPTTGEGTTSKGKSDATVGGIVLPSSLNLSPIVEDIVSAPSQEAAGDIHPPTTYEDLLQMFADMKEKMVKQQALFVRERDNRNRIEKTRPASGRR